ncbi:MAG: ATP-binding protein [Deltaproteobacteria bacterium]|nr:ATP-binding protein [Deltaproteobacteria bacterium]
MKQVVFVSGKGGTGKTSVSAALASMLDVPAVLADLDVDAANLSLLFDTQPGREIVFMGQPRAQVQVEACSGCGKCLAACAFQAIRIENGVAKVNPLTCEGCHACTLLCPEGAISFVPHPSGVIHVQSASHQTLVHAALDVAEDNSGKLVSEVRKVARKEAENQGANLIFMDGPPGIGCPVHAALNNVTLAVIVAEPSASGISDFERILQLCGHFGIQTAVVINKSTLAPWLTSLVLNRCVEKNISVLGVIPFLPDVPKALSQGKSMLSVDGLRSTMTEIHHRLMDLVHNDR